MVKKSVITITLLVLALLAGTTTYIIITNPFWDGWYTCSDERLTQECTMDYYQICGQNGIEYYNICMGCQSMQLSNDTLKYKPGMCT